MVADATAFIRRGRAGRANRSRANARAVEAWSAINSGTGNLEGLARQAGALADAFSALPGRDRLARPLPSAGVDRDGAKSTRAFGAISSCACGPERERRFLLTGHMDTVFAADSPFQAMQWIDARR
jgi:glutamate carboxypeptidase